MKKLLLLLVTVTTTFNFSSAQWQQTSRQDDAGISCMTTSGTTIFAGTAAGVLQSADSGQTWTVDTVGMSSANITNLASIGTDIFASTNNGFFLSSNSGASWTYLNSEIQYISAIVSVGPKLIAAAGNGIYISEDTGQTWTIDTAGMGGQFPFYSIVATGTNIFAGSWGNGMFLSTDSGASWTPVNNGLTNLYIISTATIGTYVFAGTSGNGVFLSTDSGSTWTQGTAGMGNSAVVNSLLTKGTTIFAGTANGVYISTDSGSTWTVANTSLTNFYVQSLRSIGNNTVAWTNGGVFISTDNGLHWTSANNGLPSAGISAVTISGTNLLATTGFGDIFESPDEGASWTEVLPANSFYDAVFTFAEQGTITFAGAARGVSSSNDNGSHWTLDTAGGVGNYYVAALTVAGTNIFAGTRGGGVYLSTDSGNSWRAVNNGLTHGASYISALTVSGTNVFAATQTGKVYLSVDSGAIWTQANGGLPIGLIYALATNGSTIFAGSVNGVYTSNNNGGHWSSTTITNYATCFAVSGPYVFAGTDSGVFYTADGGTTWQSFNEGLTDSTNISSLTTNATTLFAGSGLTTVWKTALPQLPTAIKETTTNAGFLIYPNPAKNQLTIQNTEAGTAEAGIYTTLGQLLYQAKVTSTQSVIDISTLSAGIYFLQLKSETGRAVKMFVKE